MVGSKIQTSHTIESITQSRSRFQLHAFNFLAWQDSLQAQTEEIVCQHITSNYETTQSKYPILRPSHLLLQLGQGQRRRVQHRRNWTAGDVIAEKARRVADQWQAERDTVCSETGTVRLISQLESQMEATYGPPNS